MRSNQKVEENNPALKFNLSNNANWTIKDNVVITVTLETKLQEASPDQILYHFLVAQLAIFYSEMCSAVWRVRSCEILPLEKAAGQRGGWWR